MRGKQMKISARNQLKGTVVSIQEGAVNAIVGIKIASGDIVTATVSMSSVKELGLEVGKEAYAIIKATSVMVGVE
jgi:molybdopterin-binding protein